MGGSASMLHAARTIRNNWERRKEQHKKRKKYAYATKHKDGEFDFPKVTKEELEQIKTDIRKKGQKRRTIEYSITIIATIIVFILIYLYLF